METETLTPTEQTYFDTRGATAPEPSPPPAETPTEAPVATETAPEPTTETQPDKTVPYGALAEERGKRKAAEAEIAKAREDRAALEARFDERMRMLAAAAQQEPAKPDALPSLEQDPLGHLQGKLSQQDAELARFRDWQQQQEQRTQSEMAQRHVATYAAQMVQEFAKDTPDYPEAETYARTARIAELRAFGVPDHQIEATIQQEIWGLAAQAAQSGKNPAQIVYEIAKARGYKGPAPAEAAKPSGETDKLNAIARGQQLGASLSAGGSAPAPKVSARAMLDMSDDDFVKALRTPEGRKAMMG